MKHLAWLISLVFFLGGLNSADLAAEPGCFRCAAPFVSPPVPREAEPETIQRHHQAVEALPWADDRDLEEARRRPGGGGRRSR